MATASTAHNAEEEALAEYAGLAIWTMLIRLQLMTVWGTHVTFHVVAASLLFGRCEAVERLLCQ